MTPPEGWERKSFNELGTCIRGVSYRPDDLGSASTKENVTLLRSNNIRDNRLNFHSLQFVKRSVVHENQKLQDGDIAICMSNGNRSLVGKSGQFLSRGDDAEYTVGAFCSIFRPSNSFDAGFVKQLFGSDEYQQQLDGILAGSAINNLKGSDVARLVAFCPTSKYEQAKIAEILTTVDRAIEQTEALIAKQQRIKTGLMQDLLTRGIDEHGNLRSERTHKFKDSPLGRIPVEWEVVQLGLLCEIIKDGTHLPPARVSEGPLLLGVQNIVNGRLTRNSSDTRVSWDYYKQMHQNWSIKTGDVLLAIVGATIGKTCLTPSDFEPYTLQRSVALLRGKKELLNNSFLLQYLRSPYFQSIINTKTNSTAQAGLYLSQIAEFKIPSVPIEEQGAIVAELECIDKVEEYYQKISEKLINLKTGIMQDVLTGKKRVNALLNNTAATPISV